MRPLLPSRPYRIDVHFVRLAWLVACGFVGIAGGFVYWTVKDAYGTRWPAAVIACGAAIVAILFYLAFEQLQLLHRARRVAAASTEQHLEVVSWKPVRAHERGGRLRFKYAVDGQSRVRAELLRAGEEPLFTSPSRTHVVALVSERDPARPWVMRANLKPFVVPT